jgi:hypothetical protein
MCPICFSLFSSHFPCRQNVLNCSFSCLHIPQCPSFCLFTGSSHSSCSHLRALKVPKQWNVRSQCVLNYHVSATYVPHHCHICVGGIHGGPGELLKISDLNKNSTPKMRFLHPTLELHTSNVTLKLYTPTPQSPNLNMCYPQNLYTPHSHPNLNILIP